MKVLLSLVVCMIVEYRFSRRSSLCRVILVLAARHGNAYLWTALQRMHLELVGSRVEERVWVVRRLSNGWVFTLK
jgi:hypothetical protein